MSQRRNRAFEIRQIGHVHRRGRLGSSAAVLTLGALAACGGAPEAPPPPPVTDPAYAAEVDAWHDEREEGLRSESGWFTVVGLFPLEAGENTLGSAAGNDLVWPETAPGRIGGLRVNADGAGGPQVELVLEPGVAVAVDGEVVLAPPSAPVAVATDAEEKATVFTLGSFTFYVIDRTGQLYLRLKDTEAPALKAFEGVERFPVAASWRVEARLEAFDEPQTLAVPNVLGTSFEEPSPGLLAFEVDGETYRLQPTGEAGEDLFVVFGDTTNGQATYGGGRFLVVDAPGPDGPVLLDFNRAYNPPCAFTAFATCPLPPAKNKLPIAIEAGEKKYGDGHPT